MTFAWGRKEGTTVCGLLAGLFLPTIIATSAVACSSSNPTARTATTLSPSAASSLSPLIRGNLAVGGQTRTYVLFEPESLDASQPSPLVVVLHPCDHSQHIDGYMTATTSHFDDEATAGKFIAAYPDGSGGCWNAGTCCTHADDIGFIAALIDRIESQDSIDGSRIFVTGFSFGAAMAYRVACALSSQITAVAPVSSALVFPYCHPTRAVSVFVMHGTEDAIFPIGGGGDYHIPAALQAAQTWALLDACMRAPVQTNAGITATTVWDFFSRLTAAA